MKIASVPLGQFAVLCLIPLTSCNRNSSAASPAKDQVEVASQTTQVALSPLELTAKAVLEKRSADLRSTKLLEERVRKAMEQYLIDPFSAKYINLRAGRNGTICGTVNAKNRFGAYVGAKPFVVAKNGTVNASRDGNGIDVELYGAFADAYLEACATAAEKSRHRAATYVEPAVPYEDNVELPAEDYSPSTRSSPDKVEDPFEEI